MYILSDISYMSLKTHIIGKISSVTIKYGFYVTYHICHIKKNKVTYVICHIKIQF